MTIITRFLLSLLLALLGLAAQASHERVGAQLTGTGGNDSSVRRALLIGINKYKGLPHLQGSINDIETMRHILITRWGFSENHISVVTDEAATRAGVLAALEQLVRDTGPEDTVYLHYSGHGSQVQDLNGDEKDDGLDETIVPQDGRTGEVRDITDDELDEMVARLRARNALIVLDSCHSGTATRSLDIRTRSVPKDTRVELYREGVVTTRGVVPVISSRYVLMTGAASHQEALDGPVDGRYHGFFTYALSRSLGSSGHGASPREVFLGVERELKRIQTQFGRSSMPEPQLEAPPGLLDQPLLVASREINPGGASTKATRLPWIEVQPKDADRVVLVNGLLLGAGPGSMWSVYPPGDSTFPPGRALAVVTVVQALGKDALAKVQSSGVKIPFAARAVALLPPPAPDRTLIQLLDVPQDRKKLIEDTLRKQIKDIEFIEAGRSARYLVDLQGDTLRVFGADGLQAMASFSLTDAQWGAGVARVVSRSANASELLTLDNPSAQIKVDVRVVNASSRKPKVSSRGISVVADTQPAQYHIRKKREQRTQKNSLQLEVRTTADSYVTVVDVDAEGGVNLLFPNEYQKPAFHPDGHIRAGETMLVPDSLQAGNRAGFYWDYSPPRGTDTIRVFASTDLQTAQMIRQQVMALRASAAQTRGGVTTRVAVAASVGTVREKLATRGIITVYDPTSHIPTPAPDRPDIAAPTVQTPLEVTGAVPSQMPVTPADSPADWAATSVTILVEG